jgi:hypothetical protein
MPGAAHGAIFNHPAKGIPVYIGIGAVVLIIIIIVVVLALRR